MEQLQEILSLLKRYLEINVEPNGFWDNIVQYVLPIFSMLVVIIGGIWTIYTYIKGKNREINEKILGEVYAPMYQFFVKNDSLTDLADENVNYKEVPLLSWEKELAKESISGDEYKKFTETVPILNLSRNDFINMMDRVNIGLAPQELITLFNIYKSTNFVADDIGEGEKSQRADDYRIKIEYAIRKQAYKGYIKCCKKLGISVVKNNDLFCVKSDCIQLKLPSLDKDKKNTKEGELVSK